MLGIVLGIFICLGQNFQYGEQQSKMVQAARSGRTKILRNDETPESGLFQTIFIFSSLERFHVFFYLKQFSC
jgi:hypothetical protein